MSLIEAIDEYSDNSEVKEKIIKEWPFAQELYEKRLNEKSLSIVDLIKAIFTANYIGVPSENLVDELLWKMGKTKKVRKIFFRYTHEKYTFRKNIPKILEYEIRKILGTEKRYLFSSEEIYIRYKSPNLTNCIQYNKPRLLQYIVAKPKNILRYNYRSHIDYALKQSPACAIIIAKICVKFQASDLKTAFETENVECIKIIYSNMKNWHYNSQSHWTSKMTCIAASKGNLACLKYAHENGCEWDEETCACAAAKGNLECLKYAHENGCPWDLGTLFEACFTGSIDCFEYAFNNGCPATLRECLEFTHAYESNDRMQSYIMAKIRKTPEEWAKILKEYKEYDFGFLDGNWFDIHDAKKLDEKELAEIYDFGIKYGGMFERKSMIYFSNNLTEKVKELSFSPVYKYDSDVFDLFLVKY